MKIEHALAIIAIGAPFVIMIIRQGLVSLRLIHEKIEAGDESLHLRMNQIERGVITRDVLDREIAGVKLVIDTELDGIKGALSEFKIDIKSEMRDMKAQNADSSRQISNRLDTISKAIMKHFAD